MRATRRSWPGGLGVVVTTVGLGVAVGPWGVAAGLATAICWYWLPPSYAFAVGQLLAVVALAGSAPLVPIAVTQLGLFALLAGPLSTVDAPGRAVGGFAVATLAIGAVGSGVLRTDRPLWLAAIAVAAIAATAAYGVHRYERVRLGLVEEAS